MATEKRREVNSHVGNQHMLLDGGTTVLLYSNNVKQRIHEEMRTVRCAVVMLLACLGVQAVSADTIHFSSSRRTRPRTVSITRPAAGRSQAATGQNAGKTVPRSSSGLTQRHGVGQGVGSAAVPAGGGEPVREFMGIRFGVPLSQYDAADMGIIRFSPRYFMFEEAFPMCLSGQKISGFRSEERCPITSPDQARQTLLRIKADLERRTGCPMELSDKSTIRLTEYVYSGRFTDVRISVRISGDDRSAKFYFEINNNRWVRRL